jgi:predicted phage terminase large subunit-like protein
MAKLAQERLLKINAQKLQLNTDSLMDFIPAVSPELQKPYYFQPFIQLLETACNPGGLRAVLAAPPQHGKSVTLLHALCWLAIKFPGLKHAYITYSTERAEYVSTQFQALAETIGLEPEGRLSDVRLKGGSEIRFTSIGGSLTGFTVNGLLVIDDPIKDRADAESPTIRRKAIEWFNDVARSRRHPRTSILCIATRWHPEDLSGELLKKAEPKYSYYNFKAIAEGLTDDRGIVIGDPNNRRPGEALFPEFKPPEFFIEEQQDDYSWQSLYQGEPRGRGNTVFKWPDLGSPSTYCAPRFAGDYERISIGLDFAYTAKTSADYSAAVVLGEYKGEIHVIDTLRLQVEPRDFRDRIKLLLATYPRATATCYVAATEKGGVEFFRDAGLDIDGIIAKQDKFMRAVPTAAAWNQGMFRIQAGADWINPFINEVCGFTGIKDKHDDYVDALAAAYDGFGPPAATYRPQIHTRIVGETAPIGLG